MTRPQDLHADPPPVRPPYTLVPDAWRTAVKARLVELHLTQAELARRVSQRVFASAPTISQILSGGRYPTISLVTEIDRVLEMPTEPAPAQVEEPAIEPREATAVPHAPEIIEHPSEVQANQPGRASLDSQLSIVAELRQARDAIDADLLRLEAARGAVEERIAEAHEHRARLDVRIRELRAARRTG